MRKNLALATVIIACIGSARDGANASSLWRTAQDGTAVYSLVLYDGVPLPAHVAIDSACVRMLVGGSIRLARSQWLSPDDWKGCETGLTSAQVSDSGVVQIVHDTIELRRYDRSLNEMLLIDRGVIRSDTLWTGGMLSYGFPPRVYVRRR